MQTKDYLEFFTGLVCVFVASFWNERIGDAQKRKRFHAVGGLALICGMYGFKIVATVFIPLLFTVYAATPWLPGRKWLAIFLFTACLVYNFVVAWLYSLGSAPMDINYLSTLMVLSAKLTTVVVDSYDGSLLGADAKGALPIVDFVGFCLCPSTLLLGPIYSLPTYLTTCNSLATAAACGLTPATYRSRQLGEGLKRSSLALAFLVGYFCLSPLFPASMVLEEAFWRLSWWRIFGSCYAIVAAARLKYYFSWSLADAFAAISGMSASQKTAGGAQQPELEWELMRSIDLIACERSPNLRAIIKGWNISTERWLFFYVYKRLPTAGSSKPGFIQQAITCAINAFWHGPYPGYYISFCFFALLATANKAIVCCVPSAYWKLPGWLRFCFQYVLVHLTIGVLYVPYFLLSWKDSCFFLQKLRFLPLVILIFIILAAGVVKKYKAC